MMRREAHVWTFRNLPAPVCFAVILLVGCCSGQQIDSAELHITSPQNGSIISPGQTLSVVVVPASGITLTDVSIVAETPFEATPLISTPPFQFSVSTPVDITIGKYNLTAWAIDSQGQTVVSAPVRISVERSDNPVSISPQVSQLYFEAYGQQLRVATTAKFTDGSTADVSESSNLTYTSSDDTVATVSPSGIVTAVGRGIGSVEVSYGPSSLGIKTNVAVSVAPPPLVPSPANLSFGTQQVGMVSTSLALTLMNARKSAIRILAIKSTGDFSETDNCLTSAIAAGSTCTINVAFAPGSSGPESGQVAITNSFNIIPMAISLVGTGVFAPTSLGGNILTKSGVQNARVWPVSVSNSGPGLAVGAQISSFTLAQTYGASCTPKLLTPVPASAGDMAANSSTTVNLTFDFTGCANNVRFTAKGAFSANAGAATGSMTRTNQFQ